VLQRLLASSEFFEAKLELGGIDFRAFVDSCVLDSDAGRNGEGFRKAEMFVGESPWFVRPKGENSYDQTTGNQWNLRSVATAVWETAAFSPTPQLHRTLLGLLCYYSCYYFRSIWPLPAPA
jgi:hypothetical protein